MSWYPGKFTRGLPIIPYGPGMPYATVNDLPENCVFLAPNGGVYLKQGETITPVSADLVYNGEAVTYGDEPITVYDLKLQLLGANGFVLGSNGIILGV